MPTYSRPGIVLTLVAMCLSGCVFDKVMATYTDGGPPPADSESDSESDSDTVDKCIKGIMTEDVIIRDRDSLELVSGYREFLGNVAIQLSTLTDLSGLECMETIAGSLLIGDNDSLESLDGLGALQGVEENLFIEENGILENVDALANLSGVGGAVHIVNNIGLGSLNGLRNLQSIVGGEFRVEGNQVLTTLGNQWKLELIGTNLVVKANPQLRNLDALENLSTAKGNLEIENNMLLEDISGLQAFHGDLDSLVKVVLSSNESLKSLHGLEHITTIEDRLDILYNHKLQNLSGFENLKQVGWLMVDGNNQLGGLKGFERLTNIVFAFQFSNNPVLPQCLAEEFIGQLAIVPLFGGVWLNNDPFATCN